MKTYNFWITLVLCAWLLISCGVMETPVVAFPEGTQGGNPAKLIDCEFQPESSGTQYAVECSALTTLLGEQVEKQDILGMVMSVHLPDGTVIWDTAGYINPSRNERWTANTASLIGSITKTFTAVVVMQLVEEGKLSLDDTIDTWFPEQPNGDEITIRMLLSHTSGLALYSSRWGNDLDKWSRDWTPEELLDEANKAGTLGKPGSSLAHYSNTNFIVLGRIIEKVTGNTWEHEIEARIIQPLDLKDTTYAMDDIKKEIVIPVYIKTSDGYLSLMDDPWFSQVSPSVAWAAGGIGSSASDLMTFVSALFDGRLVSKETLDLMSQPVGTAGDGRTWALGGGVMEVEGHKAFVMGGDSIGYHAFFIGTLDGKFIVTALVNTNEGNVESPSMTAIKYFSQQIESK